MYHSKFTSEKILIAMNCWVNEFFYLNTGVNMKKHPKKPRFYLKSDV